MTNPTKKPVHHLSLSDRVKIESGLDANKTFKEIASEIHRDPTTISKEIKRFIAWEDGYQARTNGNDCLHFDSCDQDSLCLENCCSLCKTNPLCHCTSHCSRYLPNRCPSLNKAPYVCNGCRQQKDCSHLKLFYFADKAQARYQDLLIESRSGISLNPEQLADLNKLISPLIKNGQPLSHIFAVHKADIPCCRNTVYNYLDQGLFDVRNIDLPRRVRYKDRKRQRSQNTAQYEYRSKRSYSDFEKFISAFPDYEVVEMDTVKGKRESGKCLLTLLFRKSNFMLIFLLPECTQQAVKDVFDRLYHDLGPRIFKKTFRVILTDNGSEFKDPWSLERTPDGDRRTWVFYCDPYLSNQKGKIEKNHEFIRYIIPKGKSMHFLTEEHTRLMMCHINSVARDGLNGASPFDLAEILINKKVLTHLGLQKISPDLIILKPALLKK